LLRRVRDNLKPAGHFLMVNHGPEEADLADRLCAAAGMARRSRGTASCVLCGYRDAPPVVSIWGRR
jgi:hypothetical protein